MLGTKPENRSVFPFIATVLVAGIFGFTFLRFHAPVPVFLPALVIDLVAFTLPAILPLGIASSLLVFFGLRSVLGDPDSKKNNTGLIACILGGLPAMLLALFWLADLVGVGLLAVERIGTQNRIQADLSVGNEQSLSNRIAKADSDARLDFVMMVSYSRKVKRSWLKPLQLMLDDQSSQVRTEAAQQIARFGSAGAPATEDLAKHLRGMEGWAAAIALSNIGPSAIPAIREQLKSDWRMTKVNACLALQRMGPKAAGAIPDLEMLLSDPEYDVQRAAREALVELRKA